MPEVRASTPSEGVVLLQLEAAPRNFTTAALYERLETALIEAREAGAAVVVLASAVEGFFVSHGHIGQTVAALTGNWDGISDPRALLRVQKELDTGPLISVAAIDGQAWGGGAELAWSCDFRVCGDASTIGQPEVLVGLPPSGGATRMTRLFGESVAKRLALDGRPVTASEAYRLGLVDRLVPAGEAVDAALDWAAWLAKSQGTLALIKDLIVGSRQLSQSESLKREMATFISRFQDETVVARALEVQRRYDEEDADSYRAFGMPRPDR